MANEDSVIGIDLGTTNSVVAVLKGDRPEIVENDQGSRLTPSMVGVSYDGERLYGADAKGQLWVYPERTVHSAKRLIGKRFEDPSVQEAIKSLRYEVSPMANGEAGVLFDGKLRPPAEISGALLRKIKEDTETKLGKKITEAVVTVPAHFNDTQRTATRDAGKIAGLQVHRLVNEPTAAALAYGFELKSDKTIAVYDLGGGTFDVTIMHIGGGVFDVLATNGDPQLGGDDIDTKIVDWFVDKFEEAESINLRESTDPAPLQYLLAEAERVKIELSRLTETRVRIPFLGYGRHIDLSLTRAELEAMAEDLIVRTVAPCEQALQDSGVTVGDIDEVILAGGMTRMPAVRDQVQKIFLKPPNHSVNPDEAVALGAALQAGVTGGQIANVVVSDVTPLTLGVGLVTGVRSPLVPRNTKIPTSRSDTFTTAFDDQTSVTFPVVQGERPMTVDNTRLGELVLKEIPPQPAAVPHFRITFDIDENSILNVTGIDQDTGNRANVTIERSMAMSEEQVAKLLHEAEKQADEDRTRRERGELKYQADKLVLRAEKLLNNPESRLSGSPWQVIFDQIGVVRIRKDSKPIDVEGLRSAMGDLETLLETVR